jgi:NAD-dependent SIR2 family protein deacetylase
MGVDSGLPDFRGNKGFWNAYPPYAKLGLSFSDLANPGWFIKDPTLAWGFYGHRLNLYRRTRPHVGFAILRRWAQQMREGAFIFTSNVDGQFQRAGFAEERIVEIHGAIDWLQCVADCGMGVFPAPVVHGELVKVDEESFRAQEPLPACPRCGSLARPNILMFGDMHWDNRRTSEQKGRLTRWLGSVRGEKLAIVECGAGTAIPSVRAFCERLTSERAAKLIRLNPREFEVPPGQIDLAMGSADGLQMIDRCIP